MLIPIAFNAFKILFIFSQKVMHFILTAAYHMNNRSVLIFMICVKTVFCPICIAVIFIYFFYSERSFKNISFFLYHNGLSPMFFPSYAQLERRYSHLRVTVAFLYLRIFPQFSQVIHILLTTICLDIQCRSVNYITDLKSKR